MTFLCFVTSILPFQKRVSKKLLGADPLSRVHEQHLFQYILEVRAEVLTCPAVFCGKKIDRIIPSSPRLRDVT